MVRLSLSFLVTVVFLFSPQIIVAKSALAGSNPPKAPVKQIDVFCQKFDKACADTCLKNKTGPITISFACSKVPPKNQVYNFGCRCNGKEKTQTALKKVSGPVPSTISTTATSYSTAVETLTSVVSEPTTITTTNSAGVTTYTLAPDQQQVVAVQQRVALVQVQVAKKASSSKSKKPQSTFCKEFSASCNRQCSRVRSSIKTQTCKKTGDGPVSDKFDLFCGCRNGKLETQHALSDIGNDGASTETVTVVGTTTSQEVVTSTVVIPVATQTILEPSSTTVVVLAPTGVIRADRKTDGTNFGYLGSSGYGLFDPDSSLVSKVFLVKDPGSTGNYQVGFSLQPSTFWTIDSDYLHTDFESQVSDYSYISSGPSIQSPSTSDSDYSQTFSWNLGSLENNARSDISPIGATDSINLNPRWAQRDGGLVDLEMFTYGGQNSGGLFVARADSGYETLQPDFYTTLVLHYEAEPEST